MGAALFRRTPHNAQAERGRIALVALLAFLHRNVSLGRERPAKIVEVTLMRPIHGNL